MTHRRDQRAVVYTHKLSARGGAERVAVAAAAVLRDAGYQTVLVSHGPVGSMSELGNYFDVDLARVGYLSMPAPTRAPFGLSDVARNVDIARQKSFLERLRPDVFFNCAFHSEIPAVAPQSIYYVHFPHQLGGPSLPGLRGLYVKTVRTISRPLLGGDFLRGYGAILANSRFTAGWVKKRWGVDAQVLYPPCPQIGAGTAERRKVILAVGRFQDYEPGRPHKHQEVMIEAFSEMGDLHRGGWELHLVGSVGSVVELQRLRKLAEGLPVVFHPDATRAELVDLYQTSTIYWHAQGYGEDEERAPIAQEHFGITTVEAMSAGLIPLVYGNAGPVEVLTGVASSNRWSTCGELAERTRSLASLSAVGVLQDLSRSVLERANRFGSTTFVAGLVEHADLREPPSGV